MKTLFYISLLLFISACTKTAYVGETEKEFISRNTTHILYTDRAKDSTVYKTGKLKKMGRYTCTYSTFKNEVCTRVRKATEIAVVK